jgi:nucleotide-binding universal stress UspA family protein
MPIGGVGRHTLVVYGHSARADEALRELADTSSERGGRLTILRLVAQESEAQGCCDRRSVLWNEISRDLAREDLAKARLAVEGHEGVQLDLLPFSSRPEEVIVREALAREADEVVLADRRATPLGRFARRRLHRLSPVRVQG